MINYKNLYPIDQLVIDNEKESKDYPIIQPSSNLYMTTEDLALNNDEGSNQNCEEINKKAYCMSFTDAEDKLEDDCLIKNIKDATERSNITEDIDIDLNCSLLSINSKLLDEDLLINENIDFMLEENIQNANSSDSHSFIYTLSEEVQGSSSVFQSFCWESDLNKSLPQSQNGSCVLVPKSFDTQNPCLIIERNDIKYPQIVISKIETHTENNDFFDQRTQLSSILNQQTLNIEDEHLCRISSRMDENTTGLSSIHIEITQSTCSCNWCLTF